MTDPARLSKLTDANLEAKVLGACMLQPEAETKLLGELREDDFFHDANRQVFLALKYLSANEYPLSPDSVVQRLKDIDRLQRVGGTTFIVEQLGMAPAIAPSKMGMFLKRLRELSNRRKIVQEAERTIAETLHAGADARVSDIVAESQGRTIDILNERESNFVTLKQATKELFKDIHDEVKFRLEGKVTKPSTGLKRLDHVIGGGLPLGKLSIVAARSSMGKTALGLKFGLAVAESPSFPEFGVHILSAETDYKRIAARVVAAKSKVDINNMLTGNLDEASWRKVTVGAQEAGKQAITIDDTGSPTLDQMRASIRRAMHYHLTYDANGNIVRRLGVVVFDYLQLADPGGGKSNRTREQEVTKIANDLMFLAKEHDVAVVALSQLSRAPELRQNKRPQLSDLRESGGIEQAAHCVIGIYRDEYYNRNTPDKGITEILILKNKDGPTGMVKVSFAPQWMLFRDLADEEAPDGFRD